MTWRAFMAARQVLFEEFFGTLMRSNNNAKSSEYAESVARLRRAQAQKQEPV